MCLVTPINTKVERRTRRTGPLHRALDRSGCINAPHAAQPAHKNARRLPVRATAVRMEQEKGRVTLVRLPGCRPAAGHAHACHGNQRQRPQPHIERETVGLLRAGVGQGDGVGAEQLQNGCPH